MSEKPEITEQEAGPAAQGEPEGAAHGSDEPGQGEPDSRHLRLLEAVLFSAPEPITEETLGQRLPEGADIPGLLGALSDHYANHGLNLVRAGGRWLFRTAQALSEAPRVHKPVPRRLSRAAMETLAIIAYHQPVTRAEIEEIRGVGLSRGTLDLLLEANWVAPKGRRRTAGRPTTWGTTSGFLVDFGIASIADLPGLDDLKAAGLLDKRPAMQMEQFMGAAGSDGEDIDDHGPDQDAELGVGGEIHASQEEEVASRSQGGGAAKEEGGSREPERE